ncbi:hypothetical protein ABK040_012116 [Willaertia magna]
MTTLKSTLGNSIIVSPTFIANAITQLTTQPWVRSQNILQTQSCAMISDNNKYNHFYEKINAAGLLLIEDGAQSLWRSIFFNIFCKGIPTIMLHSLFHRFFGDSSSSFIKIENENLKSALLHILTDIVLYPIEVIELVYSVDRYQDRYESFQFKNIFDCIGQMYGEGKERVLYDEGYSIAASNSSGKNTFLSKLIDSLRIIQSSFYKGFLPRILCYSIPNHLSNAYLDSYLTKMKDEQWGKVFQIFRLRFKTKGLMKEIYEMIVQGKYKTTLLWYLIKIISYKSLLFWLMYPFDTITKKLQVNGQPGFLYKYINILDCIKTTFKEECWENWSDFTFNNGFYNGYIYKLVALPFNLIVPPIVLNFFKNQKKKKLFSIFNKD